MRRRKFKVSDDGYREAPGHCDGHLQVRWNKLTPAAARVISFRLISL
jgi:hypothetical protein